MRTSLARAVLLVSVVLVLPLLGLAIWGEAFADVTERWVTNPPAAPLMAAAIFAILASDVFLPVPSGPLCTLAGSQLGVALGTVVSSLGMTTSAAVAYWMARRWGRPLAVRLSSPKQMDALESACRRQGPWMLVVSRPLPIVAEACALLVGALHMPARSFFTPVLAANTAVALAYCAMGKIAQERDWLPLAIAVSVVAPLALWWLWRRNQ